jgi:hypothetical protein
MKSKKSTFALGHAALQSFSQKLRVPWRKKIMRLSWDMRILPQTSI